jgi:hypothetical protein
MQLDSVHTIYHDGRHNAFTDLVRWKGKYWVCFRNGSEHRSLDGTIFVISSLDLQDWGPPSVPIATPEDNRDPKLFVWHDRLYVTSLTVSRSFEVPDTCSGAISLHDFSTLISHTEDGIHWSPPRRVWEPFKAIWWAEALGERVYGSGYLCQPVDGRGDLLPGSSQCKMNSAEFVASDDGLEWTTVSVISQERQPTECALAFLPDGRVAGFLRHNEEGHSFPEIVLASPPYTKWEKVLDLPFMTNGPCLGLVGDTVVAASRAFLDSAPPEVVRLGDPGAVRGLLVMTIDLDGRRALPELVISCPPAPEGDWPDVSCAGMVDLGERQFAMSFYDGLKMGHTDIKLARLRL